MALESANWITELDETNPAPTDKKKQGDDHLRLLKEVLKNVFPNADKAFYFPVAEAKTADFTVTSAHMGRTFVVSTAGGVVTATLPTLTSDDDGWECFFIKSNVGTNPLMIAPASGTIQSGEVAGLSLCRRCIPGAKTRVYWTGSAWYAERTTNIPIGTVLDNPHRGGVCPVGYEFAMGQTLASASTRYPEFLAAQGTAIVKDYQGRTSFGRTNMDGVTNNLLTLEINGVAIGATGGTESKTIASGHLPTHIHPINVNTGNDTPDHHHNDTGDDTPDHAHVLGTHSHDGGTLFDAQQSVNISYTSGPITTTVVTAVNTTGSGSTGDVNSGGTSNGATNRHHHATGVASTRHTHPINSATDINSTTATALGILPPAIITDFIVVVE